MRRDLVEAAGRGDHEAFRRMSLKWSSGYATRWSWNYQ